MSKVELMVIELHQIHGEVSESVINIKIHKVLEKNLGYEALSAKSNILQANTNQQFQWILTSPHSTNLR